MKIHVFDVDKLSRRVLDRTWPSLVAKRAENDPNLAPQDDPKSIKNRCQKSIEIFIDNKTIFPGHLGLSGGMRWPPGGIIGGSKNTLFEDLQVSKADLDLRVEIWHVERPLGASLDALGRV